MEKGGRLTADEEGVSCEDNLLITVLHEPADAVLGVTGRVECLDGDIANVERRAVCRCLSDALAILAPDDGQIVDFEGCELDRGEKCVSVSCNKDSSPC